MLNNNGTELQWMNFFSPFVGCLKDMEILYWAGETSYLSPDVNKELNISWISTLLPKPNIYIYLSLPTILTHSSLLHQYLQHNKCSLTEHQMATTIVSNKLTDSSNVITEDTNHNWSDF